MGGEYFFLLNQDAYIQADTISKLVEISKENPEYGIVSPMHFNGAGSALDYNFSLYVAPAYCENLFSDYVLNQVKNKIYESGFICAAAWLITKECLRRVGGFNPSFFHYGEDDNYVDRLHYKDLKIGVYPFASIFHDRENRKKPDLHEIEKIQYRKWMVRISDPKGDGEYNNYKNRLLRSYIFNSALFRFKDAKRSKKEWLIIKEIEEKVKHTLSESKSDREFIFIKVF